MAARENNPPHDHPRPEGRCLSAPALLERLDEEISRGERHGSELSCLLIVVENLEELALEHGGELRAQTLEYIANALPRELRRFDRIGMPSAHELLIVLPGADGPRGEVVARRVLERVRTIKVEVDGARLPLRVTVGLTAWRESEDAARLLQRAHAAASHSGNGEERSTQEGATRAPARTPADLAVSGPTYGSSPAAGPHAAS